MGRVGRVYRKLRATVTDQPTFFSWVLDRRLAASGLPSSRDQLAWLLHAGVDSVLTLTERPLPEEWSDGLSIRLRHLSMADHAPPAPSQLGEAADYVDAQLRDGRKLLVHCLAGKGRTGSVLAAYMVSHQGRSAKEALEELRRLRPGSVEASQEEAIYEFERHVRGARRGQ